MSRSRKFTNDVSIDVTLKDGRFVNISFLRTTAVGWENYGADADGNRGMMMLMVDSDEYSDVKIEVEIDDRETKTFALGGIEPEGVAPISREEIEAICSDYIDKHEAEPPEEEERDPDEERL